MSKAFQGGEDISMRNVAGELEGAMAAMNFCEKQNIKILHLYYDYQESNPGLKASGNEISRVLSVTKLFMIV